MKKVDVLLVAPFRKPTFRQAISSSYPVGEPWDSAALSVAAALREASLTVEYLALQNVFDAWQPDVDEPRLHGLLNQYQPLVTLFVGDSFIPSRSTATTPGIRTVSAIMRERGCRHIGVGGRLATTAATVLLRDLPDIDFCVIGEPEPVIGEVIAARLSGRECQLAVTLDRETQPMTPDPALRDLTQEPMPAWDLLEDSIEAYDRWHPRLDRLPFSVRTSAGCKFRCKFCAGVPHWLDYRTKPAVRVGEEMDALSAATGGRAEVTFLEDEIFTKDAGHVEAISRVFSTRGIVLDGVYTHASLLTPGIATDLATMARKVYFGLDSANNDLLRRMGKGQNTDVVLRGIETARQAGLRVHLELIVGSPPDTVDSTLTNLTALANFLGSGAVESAGSYVFCPHPGTEYATRPTDYGLQLDRPFEEMQESGGYPAASIEGMSRQQVYVAYLMSQLVIAEFSRARAAGWPTAIGRSSRSDMKRIFDNFAVETETVR